MVESHSGVSYGDQSVGSLIVVQCCHIARSPGDNDLRTLELARFHSHRELARPEAGAGLRGRKDCGQCGGPPGVTFLY